MLQLRVVVSVQPLELKTVLHMLIAKFVLWELSSASTQNKRFLIQKWGRLNVSAICKKRFYPINFHDMYIRSSSLLFPFRPRWWMKDNHAFLSTSVYIHVVLSFRQKPGLPLLLLTGHQSPLERTIDVLLYQPVFPHLWTVEERLYLF